MEARVLDDSNPEWEHDDGQHTVAFELKGRNYLRRSFVAPCVNNGECDSVKRHLIGDYQHILCRKDSDYRIQCEYEQLQRDHIGNVDYRETHGGLGTCEKRTP